MTTGRGIYWAGFFIAVAIALTQCGRTRINCHDWTAEQCIAFIKAVRSQP